MNNNSFAVKGTMHLLLSGAITIEQAQETVNMWVELTAKKFYAEGVLDGLKRNRKSTAEWQAVRNMGM